MPFPAIAGLGAAATRALLKTPAGQKALDKGSKAAARFLKKYDPRTMTKQERRNKKISVAGAAVTEPSILGGDTNLTKGGLIKSHIDGIARKGKTRAKHR